MTTAVQTAPQRCSKCGGRSLGWELVELDRQELTCLSCGRVMAYRLRMRPKQTATSVPVADYGETLARIINALTQPAEVVDEKPTVPTGQCKNGHSRRYSRYVWRNRRWALECDECRAEAKRRERSHSKSETGICAQGHHMILGKAGYRCHECAKVHGALSAGKRKVSTW